MSPVSFRLCVALAIIALCTGCGGGGAASEQFRQDVSAQIIELKIEIKKQKDELEKLKSTAERLELNRLAQSWEKVAYLTPGSQGYGVVRTNHMTGMTVSIKDITAFANGARVVLTFGNMSAASLTGLSAKIEYGIAGKDGPDIATARSTTINFPDQVRPGAWTHVPVVLEGLPPAQLGFIRVRDVEHNGLRLAGN